MTASSTLATLANSIIETSVDFFTTLITEYWPYILMAGAVIALIRVFGKFVNKGLGGGK
jgi:hypothetical protein